MMSRRPTLFVALAALVALAGCGTDNTVSSLNQADTAPPSAPTNIRQETRGAISILAWDASPDADVVGYDVIMYSPDPTRENAYVKVNAATIVGEEFNVTIDSSPNAWYRVKAVDQSGNRSSSSSAAWVEGEGQITGNDPVNDLPVVR